MPIVSEMRVQSTVESRPVSRWELASNLPSKLAAELPSRPYNRMQMHLSSDVQIPDGLLATNALLAENSRQGFETYSGTVQQGFEVAISSTSLGISNPLYDGHVRSRCTGKERDTESGLDYFGARYYGSSMGRFMSPDWSAKYEPVPYAKLDNPQSLNLYAYVLNNPLSNRDEDGHESDANKDKKLPAPDAQHNHTITVREVQGQGGNAFGHVTVQIDGGKEVGYGPKQDMTTKQIVEGKSVPGQVEPRADGVKTVDQVTINVTGDQAKAAQGAIDARAANPGDYNLTSNNCAQFGTAVVNAAGGNAPNDIKPSSLISDIRSQQYKANSTQTPTPAPQQQQHQPQ